METPLPEESSELVGELEQPAKKKGLRPLAIVVGVIVDLGGTNVAVAIYALIVIFRRAAQLASQGLSQAEMQLQLQGEIQQMIANSVVMIVVGILLSVLGGYVAGKMAKYNEVKHGLATGIGVLLVSVTCTLLLRLPTGSTSLWLTVLSAAANIGSTTLGGYLAYLQRIRASRHQRTV